MDQLAMSGMEFLLACNEKIGPPPKVVLLDKFWQSKLVPLANFGPPMKI